MAKQIVSAVIAVSGLAAIWAVGAPAYGTEQTP